MTGSRGHERGRSRRGGQDAHGRDVEEELRHPRGQLKAYLLLLVAESPGHGYDLVERLRPFGYERDDPAQTYRALRWLDEAGLVHPTWETSGGGPARRVFTLTPAGKRMAQKCAEVLRQRARVIELHVGSPGRNLRVAEAEEDSFEALVEAKLTVAAGDEATARRKLEEVLAERRMLGEDVYATGQVWVYDVEPSQT